MKRPDSPSTTEMPPVISVIVPALNEESVIGRCLASLKQQKPPSAHFEVIVVDNGSTDRTREIARSFGGSLSVTVLDRSGVRISALRNLGAAMARGEFLAFLDADCVAPQHWLRQTVDLLRADDFRIIGAQYRIPANSSWVAKAWYGDLWRMKDGPVSYVPGGDLAISRELFMNLRRDYCHQRRHRVLRTGGRVLGAHTGCALAECRALRDTADSGGIL